ncbi:MAG: sigma 54-interacting transcriptional regulator, partial [Planctomycetes bacterium]|nr:sigma 54-interacting transcriptional regulator [Planctomycetota bacterium]
LVARAIHMLSQRAKGPFVAVNCGSLPENLVASELFGHVRGAYTGAEANRRGRFEMAQGGTIFLDEVGELIPAIQVKLLRVLQEGEIERLGEERPRRTDVRVIAATNADLEKAIEEGRFRGDLYYRLNVFPIYLAPLRDRKADITVLADHFLEVYARKLGKRVVRISTPAIELMTAYHWPGNVRELENCIARAVLLTDDGVIRAHHLPPTLQTGNSSGTTKAGSLESMMMAFEREILIEAMKNAGGSQRRAAKALRTTPRILAYRLKKHGLAPRGNTSGAEAPMVDANAE